MAKRRSYHPEFGKNDRRDYDWTERQPNWRAKDKENDLPDWMRDNDPDMPPSDYDFRYGTKPVKRAEKFESDWQRPERTGWSTGENPMDRVANDCTWCHMPKNKKENIILLDQRTTEAIMWLMENKNVEWQMLLKGKVSTYEDGDVIEINGFVIPKQQVTGATVHNIDCIDKKFIEEQGIVCTIHSHVSMGAFFSSTDMSECNASPIKYHIVMNNKYEYQSVKQIQLPCGMIKFTKCDVVLWGPKAAQPEGVDNIQGGK